MKGAGVSISVWSEGYKLTTKCKENVFRKGQIKGKIQIYKPDPYYTSLSYNTTEVSLTMVFPTEWRFCPVFVQKKTTMLTNL